MAEFSDKETTMATKREDSAGLEKGKEVELEGQEGGEFAFEQLLLTITEVFVYKVPPLKSASGHRAEVTFHTFHNGNGSSHF